MTETRKQLRSEYHCEINLPTARISITSSDLSTAQDLIRKFEPRVAFKQLDAEGERVLLAFSNPSDVTNTDLAMAVISERHVPQVWNTTRKSVQRAA